jgi:sec-independent protein translocase protein TatB
MMKRMSFSETIFLFFLALIIFGPKKLPEIARQVGKWMNEFRRASNEFKAQIEQEIANLEVENRKQTILPPSPPPEGTASRTLNAAPSEASQTRATPADGNGSGADAAEAQTAAAASADEPLFASAPASAAGADSTSSAGAAEPLPASEAVTTSKAQESHV